MTYIESLENLAEQRGKQVGVQEGMQQGVRQGMQKILTAMLKKGLPEKTIIDLSGLTVAEFSLLKQATTGATGEGL